MVPLIVVVLVLYAVTRKREGESNVEGIVSLASAPNHRLRSDAAAAFERAVAASEVPRITSSYRSREEQQRLYDLWISGKGNLAAKPGSSYHEVGLAIDARGSALWEKAMVVNGWRRTVASEPWHWEFRQ